MTPWQIIIIAALFFTCGLAIGWLIGEAHGWFRRQKFEEARKVVDEINRKNEEALSKPIAMGNWTTPPAYEK